MMQLLLLVPLWFLSCIVAVGFLFFPRLRFLSAYLSLVSTGAVLGIAAYVILAAKVTAGMDDSDAGWAAALTVLFGFVFSAASGAAVGAWLSHAINRLMQWPEPDLKNVARRIGAEKWFRPG
jgi:hypothetical protein